MPIVRAKHISGLDDKVGRRIAFISWDYSSIRFEDSMGSDVATLQRPSVTGARMEEETTSGLFNIKKKTQHFVLEYKTKSGNEKSIILEPAPNDYLQFLIQDITYEIKRKKNEEKKRDDIAQKKENFDEILKILSRVPVEVDGEKGKVRATEEFINGCTIKNITERTSYSLLGDYVALDLETCGLSASDPVLEIAAIRFDAFKPTEVFTTLIDPLREIPEEATAVNGITNDMVNGKPTIWSVMPSLSAFIGAAPIVGHNILFDLKFLYRYGFDLQPKQKLYDTCSLAKKALKELDPINHKLQTCCKYYDIYYNSAHRAAADALATGLLFAGLAEDLAGE